MKILSRNIPRFSYYLTLNPLTTTIVAPPSNASKWQMGFNSAFKGLISQTQKTMVNNKYYETPY